LKNSWRDGEKVGHSGKLGRMRRYWLLGVIMGISSMHSTNPGFVLISPPDLTFTKILEIGMEKSTSV